MNDPNCAILYGEARLRRDEACRQAATQRSLIRNATGGPYI